MDRITELRTMDYEEYLKTPEWIAKRDQVLARDGYRCRVCNTDKNLNVHHRTYVRRGNEDLNDLTTLCQPCHEWFHERISQKSIMVKTYTPPVDREAMRREGVRQWEYYLIGLLLRNDSLWPYIMGITNEDDFADPDTNILYLMLKQRHQAGVTQPIENIVALNLMPTIDKIAEIVDAMKPRDPDVLIQEAIQCATRLKKARLLRLSTELKAQIQACLERNDKDGAREILAKSVAIQQQLRTLDAAMRLQ